MIAGTEHLIQQNMFVEAAPQLQPRSEPMFGVASSCRLPRIVAVDFELVARVAAAVEFVSVPRMPVW